MYHVLIIVLFPLLFSTNVIFNVFIYSKIDIYLTDFFISFCTTN
ncbi:unnamed protein product [Amoebophrya sp. A25]|nr:unnamed protein product [Amoebophrya sp. A25]|eukprot:GSA25T00018751001.1